MKTPQNIAKFARRCGPRTPSRLRRGQTNHAGGARRAGAITEFFFEGSAESGGVAKTKPLRNLHDRAIIAAIGEPFMRFLQTLALDRVRDAARRLEKAIEPRAGNAKRTA